MAHRCSTHDFKNEDGTWRRSMVIDGIQVHSRSAILWRNILQRCDPSSRHRSDNASYTGVINGFSSYEQFADWCNSEHGYQSRDENGRSWDLDKDLLAHPGIRKYSADTCCFLPHRLNTLIFHLASKRWAKKSGRKFVAQISNSPRGMQHLGTFSTAEEAHKAHANEKASRIQSFISSGIITNERVLIALENVVLGLRNSELEMQE